MSITAVIPVREGSTRVKDKNVRPFFGSSLLEVKIAQLKAVPEIDRIVVSSDSEAMLGLAQRAGVDAERRPAEYCDERSRSFNDVVEYVARHQVGTDVMMWVPCTCPLVGSGKIREGIALFRKIASGELWADSVATASLAKEYIFDESGPANFDIDRHVPSQMLPDWHCIRNGFFIARREDMIRWRFVYGPRPCLCELDKFEAIDIDDEEDFRMAEIAMSLRHGDPAPGRGGRSIRLLDCTLRDGAYVVDGNFGSSAIRGIARRLGDARVDIIECGWLKDQEHVEGSTYYHVPSDALRYIGEKREGAVYSAMIDWDRYDLDRLPPCDGRSIDAIRIVFPYNHYRDAIPLGEKVREKGYAVFFQAANTLAYGEGQLAEMVELVNRARPAGLSVVDTFGAMYEGDLERIVRAVDGRLDPSISLGLHSHNNLQQSFSLAMGFERMTRGSGRDVVIDSSLSGMGRGAGNAPTELVANYLNRFCGKDYDMDVIVDAIDAYMGYFDKNYEWGYSTPYFLSGMFCSHVNNIAYLTQKHKAKNKDIKQILEALPAEKRLVYDYDLLEEKYIEHQRCHVEDGGAYGRLREAVRGRDVLLIAPGKNAARERGRVTAEAARDGVVTMGVNAATEGFRYDYLFFTNPVRLSYALEAHPGAMDGARVILTSNLKGVMEEEGGRGDVCYLNYSDLIKRGWVHFDNSVIMCLRMLDRLGAGGVAIAGFDGYSMDDMYADAVLHSNLSAGEISEINADVEGMLADFLEHKSSIREVRLVTRSIYSGVLEKKSGGDASTARGGVLQ